jgi:Mce-associated membrane protein
MSAQTADVASIEAVQAAKESTVELLSYKPATVEQDLNKARDLLTGNFRDAYTSLIHDVVIPGAKQKQVTSVATVPAASTVSATANQAVVLVFINQTITMGADAPTNTASSVRVTLDKLNDRWVISEFDPV